LNGEFAIEFQNSDRFSVGYGDQYEFLPQPFSIASGVTVPVGGYDFATVRAGFNLGQQRRVSGNFSVEHGTFYSGQKTAIGLSRGRTNITPQLSVETGAPACTVAATNAVSISVRSGFKW